jgi:hypothetical protein
MKGTEMKTGPARAADPDSSPAAVLSRTLEARLRAEAQSLYAGLALGPDGILEVFAVGNDLRFAGLVGQIRQAVAPQLSVRIRGEQANNLKTLEQVRDQITASRDAIGRTGINIVEWGVDIRANKVRVGILELSADAVTRLQNHLGADRIDVVSGSVFRANTTD